MVETLKIERLGRKGDGIAGNEIFVPFTLPDEVVIASGNGPRRKLVSIETKSPDRIDPICPHFGTCGGCQTQHINHQTYLNWKTGLVSRAFD